MSEIDSDGDEEMALFVRRFNRFMRRGRFQNKPNVRPESKDEIICYNCNKPGHMKFYCPLLKKKNENYKQRRSFKKKALHVTWDNSDSSSDDEEEQNEVSYMCFLAHDNEVCEIYELTHEEL